MIRWEAEGYEVAFTTRVGGVSEGPYASLNLGRKSGDDVERVDENRRIACAAIGADLERLALNYQVHSAARAAGRGRRGAASTRTACGPTSPGCRSSRCPPTACRSSSLVRTRTSRAVAVLHAGWKGLLAGDRRGGRRTRSAAARSRPRSARRSARAATRWGRRSRRRTASASATTSCASGNLDLWTSAERALRAAGVERVDRFDRCTACEPETFFSHRRDDGRTGRQGVIAYVAG